MSQVAREWRRHRQARRIAKDPFAAERQVTGRLVALLALDLGSSRMARAIASSRTASGRFRIASRRRIGSNSNWNGTCGSSISQELESPHGRTRLWRTRRCGPLVGKSSGMIENVDPARPGLPRGELLHRGAAGAEDAVRPLQVIRTDVARGHRSGTGPRSSPRSGSRRGARADIADGPSRSRSNRDGGPPAPPRRRADRPARGASAPDRRPSAAARIRSS